MENFGDTAHVLYRDSVILILYITALFKLFGCLLYFSFFFFLFLFCFNYLFINIFYYYQIVIEESSILYCRSMIAVNRPFPQSDRR